MEKPQIEGRPSNFFLLEVDSLQANSFHFDNTKTNIKKENEEIMLSFKGEEHIDQKIENEEEKNSAFERVKSKKKTLPKTNSYNSKRNYPTISQNINKIQAKPVTSFSRNNKVKELETILLENARKKYIKDLWNNNFLIIAMFIKKFIETLKSINIVSKFLRMTKYHYDIIGDKVFFFEGVEESIHQNWLIPSKTTKKFVIFFLFLKK